MDDHRRRLFASAALNLSTWLIKVRKLKAIYHTLNMFNFDVTSRCLIGECWCPADELGDIRLALQRGTVKRTKSFHKVSSSVEIEVLKNIVIEILQEGRILNNRVKISTA